MPKKGILIQGTVRSWTKKVIENHIKNFPDVEILFSTWTNEDVEGIPCEIIKTDPPPNTKPNQSNVNFQKVGTLAGLEKMNSDVIMKCRSDQLIHNKFIFDIYEIFCPKDRIMIVNHSTIENIDYLASDFIQIGTKEILSDYWESIKTFDGSFPAPPEIYLTANHILRGKKDQNPWNQSLYKYYYVCDYKDDFQIEWERLSKGKEYEEYFNKLYPKCVKSFLKQFDHVLNKYRNDVLYFLHIPKTSGSTLITIIDKYFPIDSILNYHDWPSLLLEKPNDFAKYRFIRGHFGYGLYRILNKKPVYITMLRNPSDVIISTYNMIRRQPKDADKYGFKNKKISEIIIKSKIESLKNTQTRWLAIDQDILSITREMNSSEISDFIAQEHQSFLPKNTSSLLNLAKQHLSEFAFVGLVEKMEESLFLLHYTFGWIPIRDVLRKNVDPYKKSEIIDNQAKKILEEWTELDWDLYNYAKTIFESRYSKMVRELKERFYEHKFDNMDNNDAVFEMLKKHHLAELEMAKK